MNRPNTARILIECELKPAQGLRFQPTGFPSLGAAEYVAETEEGRVNCLLVESTPSLANWLEKVCMDGDHLVEALAGMPVITLVDGSGKFVGNTMTEAHRINSAYLLHGKDSTLMDMLKSELGVDKNNKTAKASIGDFAKFLFQYDTPTLLHGTFIPKIAGGKYRITRMLSSFIDAVGVSPAEYGGAKKDNIDTTGKTGDKGGSKEGYGNIIYPKRDYTARSIMLYFSIDLSLMRSYRLGEAAEELLLALAVWKIRRLTRHEIRFRTACDLRVVGDLTVMSPADGYELPSMEEVEADLKNCIVRCRAKSLFAGKNVVVKYDGE